MEVFPSAYFGNIVYYKRIVAAAHPIIETCEHFVKQTLRSRCEILGPNSVQTLSIPVVKVNGSKTAMKDLQIVDDNWRTIHWRSIVSSYASAPFFDYYESELKELLWNDTKYLIEFNKKIHQRICSWLEIGGNETYSDAFIEFSEVNKDYRNDTFELRGDEIFTNYTQVFKEKVDCVQNLSILDLIMNEGPLARKWIVDSLKFKVQ